MTREPARYDARMPRVSVVITSFNSGAFLERSVRSVLAQTMTDLEVIVVDDGSDQPQSSIVDLDPRVQFVAQPRRGVSVARNVGVARASGDLIAFLDHDDEWDPRKLETQLADVERVPDAAFWCTRFTWVRGEDEILSDGRSATYAGLLADQTVLMSSVLVGRRAHVEAGGNDPLLSQMEDWEYLLRLAMSRRPIVLAPTPLVRYYLHETNASRDFRPAARARFAILDAHAERARRVGDGEALAAVERGRARTRELFAFQAVDAARARVRVRDWRGAASHLSFAARLQPAVVVRSMGKAIGARWRPRRR